MSIVSIGSIRGTLGVAENQPSLNTPRLNVRSTEQDAPDGATATQPAGTAFAAPNQPWAPWPPYMPPPLVENGAAGGPPTAPAIPLPSDTKDSELVVKPQPPAVREALVIESLPLRRREGDVVVAPLPVPVVPRPPVDDEPVAAPLPPPGDQGGSEGLVATPVPPPGRPVNPGGPVDPGAPVVPAIPLPVEASGFATLSPLVPFESDRKRER